MCFDERTSWITFFIGTFGNVWMLSQKPSDRIRQGLFVIWQSVLFVQLLEALIWRNLDRPMECSLYSKMLQILITLHPVIFTLAAAHTTMVSRGALLVAGAYTVYALISLKCASEMRCTRPDSDCDHLSWWWLKQHPFQGMSYVIVSFLALAFFLNKEISFSIIAFLAVTFFISNTTIYRCASGTMWCWFSAFAPFFSMLVLYT